MVNKIAWLADYCDVGGELPRLSGRRKQDACRDVVAKTISHALSEDGSVFGMRSLAFALRCGSEYINLGARLLGWDLIVRVSQIKRRFGKHEQQRRPQHKRWSETS